MIKKHLALISVITFATPFSLFAEEVKHAAKDGMVIHLGNYTQQIKVRAKALAPDNCKVDFSVKEQTITVVAPANAYSDWVGVGPSFLAPAEAKLGVSVKCDAGAITQVKYYK